MEVRLLGPIELVDGDAAIRLGGPKERAILAMLALDPGRTVSEARLIDGVWGEEAPRTAAKVVQNYVLRLRKTLGGPKPAAVAIDTRPRGYALVAGEGTVDVARLAQLAGEARRAAGERDLERALGLVGQALALWRGDTLADMADLPFAGPEVLRLDELRAELVDLRFTIELDLGRHDLLVAELEVMTGTDPLRERLWAHRMLALYRGGRQAEALRAFQDCRLHLVDELGIEPSPQLTALERAILAQDPALDWVECRLPSGVVTFLTTEIHDATRLLHDLGDHFPALLSEQRRLVRDAVRLHRGIEVRIDGDGCLIVFTDAGDALLAAADLQRQMAGHQWASGAEVSVRAAVHTATATPVGGDYDALAVHQVTSMRRAAHGGQVVLSRGTAVAAAGALLDDIHLVDLGVHQLQGFPAPERLYQLAHPAIRAVFPPLRTRSALAHNLPRARTTFIGRTEERAELIDLLGTTGVVTVVGSPGVGKTRLAIEVAFESLDRYPDGAWLVELAPVSDPAVVAHTVAAVLGVHQEGGGNLTAAVIAELGDRSAILVIDNCEHVVDAVAQLAEAVTRACPHVAVLATSREPLRVDGEVVWRLATLATPDPSGREQVGAVARYEAVRLFVDRAGLVAPGFVLDEQNVAAVAAICARLDGIALALELAAARVGELSVAEVAAALADRFSLLVGGRRSALPRHQTLRAAIDWSFDLLGVDERRLLGRLAVFSGSFGADAATSVCGEGLGIAAGCLLDRLILRSLILVEQAAGEPRYRLLETVREYAGARLFISGEEEQVRSSHVSWFLALAEQARDRYETPDQARWMDILAADHDNLRQALRWSLTRGSTDSALRLAEALGKFWHIRAFPAEGRSWLEQALSAAPAAPDRLRARALFQLGTILNEFDRPASRQSLSAALTLFRATDDSLGAAQSLAELGHVSIEECHYAEARVWLDESLALYRALGDLQGTALTLERLGVAFFREGQDDVARGLLDEACALQRRNGDHARLAWTVGALGLVAMSEEDRPAAAGYFEESLALHRQLDCPRGVAWALSGLAEVSVSGGDPDAGAKLFGQALRIQQEHSYLGDIRWSRSGLGRVALAHGDLAAARRHFLASLEIAGRHAGPGSADVAVVLRHLGLVRVAEGELEGALCLLASATSLADEYRGIRLSPQERTDVGDAIALLRRRVGAVEFDRLWTAAAARPADSVLEEALSLADEA